MKLVVATPDSPSRTVFAVNMRALRLGHGWSQAELGAKLGYGNRHACVVAVSAIETTRRLVTLEMVDKVAAALGVPPARMLERHVCPICHGTPPANMTCRICGADGPEE